MMGCFEKADRSASSDTTWISCGCILNEVVSGADQEVAVPRLKQPLYRHPWDDITYIQDIVFVQGRL